MNFKILGIGAIIILALLLGGFTYISFLNSAHEKELKALSERLIAQCSKEKTQTYEVAHALETELADLSSRLAAAKRVQPNCLAVTPPTTRGGDVPSANSRHVQQNGISGEWLLEYGAEAESIGLRLDACQSFIRKVWEDRGYDLNP